MGTSEQQIWLEADAWKEGRLREGKQLIRFELKKLDGFGVLASVFTLSLSTCFFIAEFQVE